MIKKIAICDSGVGGLAVLKMIVSAFPFLDCCYLSDGENFPYGNKSESQIKSFCKKFIFEAIKLKADLLVVACNTMSVIGEQIFKNQSEIPTVFIRAPLWEIMKSDLSKVKILCTEATAKGKVFKALSSLNAKCVLPMPSLAEEVEKNLILSEKIDFFNLERKVGDSSKIFLCCTHYIHLLNFFKQSFMGAQIFDGTELLFDFLNAVLKDCKNFQKGTITFHGSNNLLMKRVFYDILKG